MLCSGILLCDHCHWTETFFRNSFIQGSFYLELSIFCNFSPSLVRTDYYEADWYKYQVENFYRKIVSPEILFQSPPYPDPDTFPKQWSNSSGLFVSLYISLVKTMVSYRTSPWQNLYLITLLTIDDLFTF